MKNYKEYEKQIIGTSDVASLTLRYPMSTNILYFGEDNTYKAYVVDADAEIGEHYKLESEGHTWLKIYDDCSLTAEFKADVIKVYRAKEMGCIIQLIYYI